MLWVHLAGILAARQFVDGDHLAAAATMRSEHPELARPEKRCSVPLATVSRPWVPACGSLEPPRRDGENAQKTGKNGGKMGQIQSKTREGVGSPGAPPAASGPRGPPAALPPR